MKHFYFFLLLISFFSCDFKKLDKISKKNDKINEILKGVWNENEFRNDFFDISFNLDTSWTQTYEAYNSYFGGNYLEAKHNENDPEGNPIAEIKINYKRKTFFEKKPTEKKELLKEIMRYNDIYLKEQLEVSPITEKKIGKHKFQFTNIKVNTNDYDYNVNIYLRKVKSYSIVIESTYYNEIGLNVCNQFLDSIK